MYVKEHIILGVLFSSLLFVLFPEIGLIGLSLIFLSAVLIDVDHYLYYVKEKKDFSLRNAYNWFIKKNAACMKLSQKQREKNYEGFFFLHGIEILIVLLLLTFISKYFFFIFIGVSFHLLLDLIYELTVKKRVSKISIIFDYFKIKKILNKNA